MVSIVLNELCSASCCLLLLLLLLLLLASRYIRLHAPDREDPSVDFYFFGGRGGSIERNTRWGY